MATKRKKRSGGAKKGGGSKGKPAVLSLGRAKKSSPKVRIGYTESRKGKATRKKVLQARPKGKSYKRSKGK